MADTRTVVIDMGQMGALALGELIELSELSGIDLSELQSRLNAGHATEVVSFVLALAVVLERRVDPGLTMADARRWDIQVVEDDGAPDPTRGQRGPGPGLPGS